MKKDIIKFLVLLAVAIGAGPVSGGVWQWSQTAGTNSNADPHINWAEGQAPSSVNDSARAMMAELAKYRDDISGALTTGGLLTAYTLATNQVLAATPTDGQLIAFTPNVTNGAAVTLAADGGTAYAIQSSPGVAIGAATLIAGTPYTAKFSLANSAWILRDFYGNPFSVPLGGLVPYTGATAPNSNFILPAGQCISTTSYAAYWVLMGSPASGSCSGGQFKVVDLRGRTLSALDNLNGSAANIMTSSSSGCGVAFTSVGAICGNESQTLTQAQLPSVTLAQTNVTNTQVFANIGTGFALGGGSTALTGLSNTGGGGTSSMTGAGSPGALVPLGGSGNAHPIVQPTMAVTYLLRVI